MALRMPSSLPFSATRAWARAHAPAAPEITTWPGLLRLATSSTSAWAQIPHSCVAEASSAPISASMPEGTASAAACIATPRRRTRRTASAKVIEPAATSAVYSPSDSPAAATNGGSPWERSAASAIRLATRMAGWLRSVRPSSASGPSAISRPMGQAEHLLRLGSSSRPAAGTWVARSLPMPTYWAPWPGNTSASGMTISGRLS